jgi:hypothetical protein
MTPSPRIDMETMFHSRHSLCDRTSLYLSAFIVLLLLAKVSSSRKRPISTIATGIYVPNFGNNTVRAFNSAMGTPSTPTNSTGLSGRYAVTVDAADNISVVNLGNSIKLTTYSPTS